MHIVSLLEKCVDSLECLIVDRFNFEPVHLPKLTDLYVLKREIEEAGDPSNLFHLLQVREYGWTKSKLENFFFYVSKFW